jgi:2-oxoglutarate ferredoxin oxidoreductase subunit beta
LELLKSHFSVGELVIGAKGKFFARTIDTNVALSTQIYIEAAKHKGTSVIEVLQNCVIFNDGIHDTIAEKEVRDDRTLILKHGEPMIFGKNNDKGLFLKVAENLKPLNSEKTELRRKIFLFTMHLNLIPAYNICLPT